MKRKLFFWLEKLKITPYERVTVVALLVILLILSILNSIVEPDTPFYASEYKAIEDVFERRNKLLSQQKAVAMARYNPGEQQMISASVHDTLPTKGDTTKSTNNQKLVVAEKINLNSANQKQLETLPGIGPAYARRIIDYRETKGLFNSVDELIRIKGIGEKRLKKLEPFVKI